MWVVSFSAHANLITNFNVEAPARPSTLSLLLGSVTLTGWTVTTAEIAQVRNGNFAGINAAHGPYSVDLTGSHDLFAGEKEYSRKRKE